jgi:thiol-disulfide isomerase/thioredoxin
MGSMGSTAARLRRGLLALSTLLALAGPGPGGTPEAAAQSSPESLEARLRRDEAELLHRRLELRGLRRLVGGTWKPAEAPLSRLVVVHIWAVECKPCVDEMPLVRALLGGLRKFPVVQVAFVSETADLGKLQAFIEQHRAELPQTDFYQVDSDVVRQPLQNRAQPLTLLIDERGVVRQAFVGSLRARRSELTQSIERYLKAL